MHKRVQLIPLIFVFFLCFAPQLKYKEDYNKNVKGQWCETPYFDVATARVAMENLSDVRGGTFVHLFDFVCGCLSRVLATDGCRFPFDRGDTRSITKTQKTKFISCRRTRPSMAQTRRLVLLPVRWARTHKHTPGYFYKSYLMRKTRQRGDPRLSVERESTLWIRRDAAKRPRLAPPGSQARSGPTARTRTITSSRVATCQHVRKRLFSRLYNSRPPTLNAQWRPTSQRCLTLPRFFLICIFL